ncbi:MAG: hypothetical protein JXB26_06190 [Candidatus Aminicenantes bacterium]|nr:hypothetical protein [Candidatus Aminicenantes bacterium]
MDSWARLNLAQALLALTSPGKGYSTMSSSVDLFTKSGRLAAAAFQSVLGLRGMLLYSGLFPEYMFLLWQEYTVPVIRSAPCSTWCFFIISKDSWPIEYSFLDDILEKIYHSEKKRLRSVQMRNEMTCFT